MMNTQLEKLDQLDQSQPSEESTDSDVDSMKEDESKNKLKLLSSKCVIQ